MADQNVLGFIDGPDRESSLNAVSKALLKVRALDGMTCARLGEILKCSSDTIQAASNEDSMLCFTSIARLVRFFPEQSAPILNLLSGEPDLGGLVRRIRADLAEIEREVGGFSKHNGGGR